MRVHYDPCSTNPAPNFADMAFSSPFLPPSPSLFRQSKRATGKIEHTIRKHRLRRLERVTNCGGGRAWRGRHYFRQRFTRALNHAHFTSHRGITIEADRWMASSRVSDSPSLLLLLPPSLRRFLHPLPPDCGYELS